MIVSERRRVVRLSAFTIGCLLHLVHRKKTRASLRPKTRSTTTSDEVPFIRHRLCGDREDCKRGTQDIQAREIRSVVCSFFSFQRASSKTKKKRRRKNLKKKINIARTRKNHQEASLSTALRSRTFRSAPRRTSRRPSPRNRLRRQQQLRARRRTWDAPRPPEASHTPCPRRRQRRRRPQPRPLRRPEEEEVR